MYENEKRYLSQYRTCVQHIRTLKEQEATLRRAISSAKSQQLSDMPRGGVPVDMAEAVCNLQLLLDDVLKETRTSLQLMAEIEKTIRSVADPIEQRVLHLRYMDLIRWESIANKLGYSTRRVLQIHGRALSNLYESA